MIEIRTGDITQIQCDAIVNAANASLMGGGGVDGAIHRAGGPEILDACKAIRQTHYPDGLPTGEAIKTTAGNLPTNYVIHTVGPIYTQSHAPQQELKNCYTNALRLAKELGCKSVAFPAISTGVYGYPKEEACKIAYESIQAFMETNTLPQNIYMVFFSQDDATLCQKINHLLI